LPPLPCPPRGQVWSLSASENDKTWPLGARRGSGSAPGEGPQFSGTIGVAALGTVFLQRVSGDGGFVGAPQVVLLLGTVLYAVTLGLVGLLPKVAQDEMG
jgi:hypothetical protein